MDAEIVEVPEETTTVASTLPQKLLATAQAINGIAKDGRNEHQHYDYVQEVDVKRAVRAHLYGQGVLVIPSVIPGSLQTTPAIGGKGMVTSIEINYLFLDVESGDRVEVVWAGAGTDIGGDKGIYKAFAGALKYMFLTLFLIPAGDDPEGEATTVSAAAHVDDARPAAPLIPIDRAEAIKHLSEVAGCWDAETGPHAVLKAKLATVGVTTGRIGHLNVDQAEAVEAWLKTEVPA